MSHFQAQAKRIIPGIYSVQIGQWLPSSPLPDVVVYPHMVIPFSFVVVKIDPLFSGQRNRIKNLLVAQKDAGSG